MSQASPLQLPHNKNEESLRASWKKGKQWSEEERKHVRGYFFSLRLIRPGQEDHFLYEDFVKREKKFKLYAMDFESSDGGAALLCCSTRDDQRLPTSYIMAEIKRLNITGNLSLTPEHEPAQIEENVQSLNPPSPLPGVTHNITHLNLRHLASASVLSSSSLLTKMSTWRQRDKLWAPLPPVAMLLFMAWFMNRNTERDSEN